MPVERFDRLEKKIAGGVEARPRRTGWRGWRRSWTRSFASSLPAELLTQEDLAELRARNRFAAARAAFGPGQGGRTLAI
jgi:hypothetical protein